MPELPDVTIYVERLRDFVVGETLSGLRIASPFVLRSVEPPVERILGQRVVDVERLGKRIVFTMEQGQCIVVHLMIAGRLRWKKPGAAVPKGNGLAAFDFPDGTLIFTEASKKKRASIHLIDSRAELGEVDRGGLEVLEADLAAFVAALTAQNHTLKRALTDSRVLSGIGNAYSDEILFAARLSPFKQTQHLSDEEMTALHSATTSVLERFTNTLRGEVAEGFPDKVTAFRDDMAVHGRYRQPCVECGSPVQRIRYADNEANYCARCQTGGRLLADRALSRLLKANWPKTLDELE